jgi:hypothetical protein
VKKGISPAAAVIIIVVVIAIVALIGWKFMSGKGKTPEQPTGPSAEMKGKQLSGGSHPPANRPSGPGPGYKGAGK